MALSKIFVFTKKWPRRGQKIKIFFFQKKYSKDGKKNLGTSGTIFAQNRFWGSGGVRPTVTSHTPLQNSHHKFCKNIPPLQKLEIGFEGGVFLDGGYP